MFTDFNMVISKKTVKIPTLGGAIAAFVTVDGHSEYVHGILVHSVANSVEHIKTVHQQYVMVIAYRHLPLMGVSSSKVSTE